MRGLLPFLVFGATYLAVRYGLILLEAQVWGAPATGQREPWVTMLMVLASTVVAITVTMLVMRGRWGRGGRGGKGV